MFYIFFSFPPSCCLSAEFTPRAITIEFKISTPSSLKFRRPSVFPNISIDSSSHLNSLNPIYSRFSFPCLPPPTPTIFPLEQKLRTRGQPLHLVMQGFQSCIPRWLCTQPPAKRRSFNHEAFICMRNAKENIPNNYAPPAGETTTPNYPPKMRVPTAHLTLIILFRVGGCRIGV